jgi:hypothetical protein
VKIDNMLKQLAKIIGIICLGLVIVFVGLMIWLTNPFIFQMIFTLVLGWITFLEKVIGYVVVSKSRLIEWAIAILFLTGGTHWFLSWFYKNSDFSVNAAAVKPKSWKLKWSIALIGIFLLMFVTSISITGLIHQTGWLAKSPFTKSSWEKSSWTFYGYKTKDIFRAMGMGLESYSEANQHLPIVSQPVPFKDLKIPKEYYHGFLVDQWGMPILYSSDGNSYVLRSYGKNKILGGGSGEFDDLLYSDGELLGDRRRN